jgi:hypothetical protein
VPNAAKKLIAKGANVLCDEAGTGIVIAPTRTEIVTDAVNLGASYPTVAGTGTTVQDQPGPDGGATGGWTLSDTSAAAQYSRQRNQAVANDSATYTLPIYLLKTYAAPTSFPQISVVFTGGTTKSSALVVNPQTGEISISDTNAIWRVEDAGLWWRVICVISNNTSGNTTLSHVLVPARAPTLTTTGNVAAMGSATFAWPNIQLGDSAVPPILAAGAGGGNIVSVDWPYLSEQAFVGYLTVDIKDTGATSPSILVFDNGATNNYFAIGCVSGRTILTLMASSASQAAVDIGEWRTGRQTIAFVCGPNYVNGRFVRGLLATADTSATLPAMNRLGLGGRTGVATNRCNCIIEKVFVKLGAANAAAMDAIYSAAVAWHGVLPTAWDNFDRADGAPLALPSGQTWLALNQGGGVTVTQAAISGKTLITADSALPSTAAYSALYAGRPITRMRARVSWLPGVSGNGSAGLICTKNWSSTDIGYISNLGSLHIIFTDQRVDVGIYVGNVLTILRAIRFPTAMALDGTIYEIGWDRDGNTITIRAPKLPLISVTDPQIGLYAGPVATFEHYWLTGACRPVFRLIEAS